MNKKALALQTIIRLVLVGLILFGSIYLLRKPTKSVGELFDVSTSRNQDCLDRSDKIKDMLPKKYNRKLPQYMDIDEDGYHDGCDVCVGRDKSSDNKQDFDLDGMPDACDEKDRNPKVKDCKGTFNSLMNRCELPGFQSNQCLSGSLDLG